MAPKQDLEASETGQENLNLLTKQVIDPSIDENPVRLESKALSSLLARQLSELHLHIIENLAPSVDSGLLSLQETNRCFQSISFPTDHLAWSTTHLEINDLWPLTTFMIS